MIYLMILYLNTIYFLLWRDATKHGNFHIDHITSWAGGGSNEECNLQLLCFSCHRDKRSSENKQRQYIKPKETASILFIRLFIYCFYIQNQTQRQRNQTMKQFWGKKIYFIMVDIIVYCCSDVIIDQLWWINHVMNRFSFVQ